MEIVFITEYTKIAPAAKCRSLRHTEGRRSWSPALDQSPVDDYIFTNKYNFYLYGGGAKPMR
jgi:hypothetical protein